MGVRLDFYRCSALNESNRNSNRFFSQKGCLKSFLNAKVRSLMIKCINHSFQSDGHCQCRPPRCTLCWAAVLWPMCFARTTYRHSLSTNGPAITIAIDTYYKQSLKETQMVNTVVYEINNFIDIFWVNFDEEKRPNFKMSYLSFYCKFQVISNTWLKNRSCSKRLQNFIFVPCGTKLWNEGTPFAKAKKMVPRCVYRHARIKVALYLVTFRGKATN